jgi:chromosome partitioning protein
VLVIDTDSQAAATRWLGRDHMPGLTRSFSGSLPLERLVQSTCADGVEIIPASTSLATLERTLDGIPGAETLLRAAIDELDPDRWDYLICDTPPSLGIVVNAVLAAVQELIVPVEARPVDLAGLSRILSTAGRVQRRLNHSLCEARLVISRANHTGVSRSVEAQVRKRYGARVFATAIPERISIARSSGLGIPVSVHEPKGAVAKVYRSLAREIQSIEVLSPIERARGQARTAKPATPTTPRTKPT